MFKKFIYYILVFLTYLGTFYLILGILPIPENLPIYFDIPVTIAYPAFALVLSIVLVKRLKQKFFQ